MLPIIQIKNRFNYNENISSSMVDTNIIYYNTILHGQEDIPTTSTTTTEYYFDDRNKIDITISNVSTSFNLKTHLNLRYVAHKGYNVEYRRDKGKLTMKLRKPQTTANIWSSGKIVCIGCTSEYEAKIASKRIARIIQRLGYREAKFSNYRVMNVLGSCTLPFPIRIIPFSEKYKTRAQYEPELNPGVTYKFEKLNATLKIFSTGSITVNACSEAVVQQAIEHIYPLVKQFERNKLLDEQRLQMIKKINNEQQNTEVLESTGNTTSLYDPVEELLGPYHYDSWLH